MATYPSGHRQGSVLSELHTGADLVPELRQPWLHELQIAVDGPSTTLSPNDGQIGGPGTGVFIDDRRVVSVLQVRLDDREPVAVAASATGPVSEHWLAARHLGTPGADPTVEVHRRREIRGPAVTEQIVLTSRAAEPVRTRLEVVIAGDGADITDVKTGRPAGPPLPVLGDGGWRWRDERHVTRLDVQPHPEQEQALLTRGLVLHWPLTLPPGGSWAVTLTVTAERVAATAFDADAGSGLADWDADALAAQIDDPVLREVVRTSLTDLAHLTLRDPQAPDDLFVGAGSPWYLTLFGRDSIWAARFMLGLSPALALGTLRALARRQATGHDPELAAEPGKILHEVRRTPYAEGTLQLPPLYYGSVDSTPLWVVLLHEAWRAGLGEDEVRELLPALHAALGWMRAAVERSPDGLLRYLDTTGHGLNNQGWKDSGDSMRRSDGSIAPAPIALLEAQAYGVQAALGAAELLDALGEPAGEGWRQWAGGLAARVRATFWVGRGEDSYLAMALDAHGRPVDGVGSNMGHVLGTGLLTAEETAQVVARLMRPDLLREFGIGTLSTGNPAYNPIGYHTGSVWTHDTAIAMRGLAAEGYHDEAHQVAAALLRLGVGTGFRFPELCGGEPVGRTAVPYPASCRPQGWAAASAAALMSVLRPEVLWRGAASRGAGAGGATACGHLRAEPGRPASPITGRGRTRAGGP